VVDGGSADGTPQLARALCDRVITAPRGRALQMNAGAREARGDAVVFLHADTRLPALADEMILCSLKTHVWGRFDVQIDARHPLLKLVACAMNLRSRLTGIATGDQAIFVRRDAFREFAEIAFRELDMPIEWQGRGLKEKGVSRKTGKPVIEIDPEYYRPTEVDNLIGDSTRAKKKIGWAPKVKFEELVKIMIKADYDKVSKRGY